MLPIFLTALNAIFPIVLLILLGYWLRHSGFLTEDFLKIGNKLVFRLFLPAMLFVNIYSIEDFSAINWGLVLYSVSVVFLLFGIGLVLSVLTTQDRRRRGVILQCAFRSNFAIIGISLAASLAGDAPGAAQTVNGVVAIIQAFTIPLFNILGVIALTVFVRRPVQDPQTQDGAPGAKHTPWSQILTDILRNPLIIGIALGVGALALRFAQEHFLGQTVFTLKKDLAFLYRAVESLGQVATPLALIVLGGQFTFSAAKSMTREILVGTCSRILLAPLLGVGCAILLSECSPLLSFGQTEYPALIALFGTPVAVSSAIMAKEMHNDGQLAAQLVVFTSIFSLFTLFAQVFLLMSFGLLAV